MIYIVQKYSDMSEDYQIDSVWEVGNSDVSVLYAAFMQEKAKELDIVINPYWLHIMNQEDHHPNLSDAEYAAKFKAWKKIQRQWNIKKFILGILKGRKIKFETLYI